MEQLKYGRDNDLLRENWIQRKLLELPEKSIILDAGAGDQNHKKYCKHLKYVSQDIAEYDGKANNTGIQVSDYEFKDLDIISDITNIPRKNESFDAILCSEVLEHVVNPVLAIKELSRLLKKNGRLILTAPFCSITHFAPYHYSTGFSSYWYFKTLPVYGLTVVSVETYGDYFSYLAQELHRLPSVAQKYCENLDMSEGGKEAINATIDLLSKLGEKPNTSWELLSYGHLVIAEKIFDAKKDVEDE